MVVATWLVALACSLFWLASPYQTNFDTKSHTNEPQAERVSPVFFFPWFPFLFFPQPLFLSLPASLSQTETPGFCVLFLGFLFLFSFFLSLRSFSACLLLVFASPFPDTSCSESLNNNNNWDIIREISTNPLRNISPPILNN